MTSIIFLMLLCFTTHATAVGKYWLNQASGIFLKKAILKKNSQENTRCVVLFIDSSFPTNFTLMSKQLFYRTQQVLLYRPLTPYKSYKLKGKVVLRYQTELYGTPFRPKVEICFHDGRSRFY